MGMCDRKCIYHSLDMSGVGSSHGTGQTWGWAEKGGPQSCHVLSHDEGILRLEDRTHFN